jgi:hypothetical protein
MNTAFYRLLLWTILLSALSGRFCGSRACAQDNPFGFPEPIDARKTGSVMLHGGGNGVRDYVRQVFLRLAGGSDARVVLLPSDYEQREPGETLDAYEKRLSGPRGYGRWRDLCRDNHASFQFLFWNCPEDPGNAKFFSALEGATGIWMPADDQEWVIKRFAGDPLKPTRFMLALRVGEWQASPRPSSPGTPTTKMPAGFRRGLRSAWGCSKEPCWIKTSTSGRVASNA